MEHRLVQLCMFALLTLALLPLVGVRVRVRHGAESTFRFEVRDGDGLEFFELRVFK